MILDFLDSDKLEEDVGSSYPATQLSSPGSRMSIAGCDGEAHTHIRSFQGLRGKEGGSTLVGEEALEEGALEEDATEIGSG